MAVAEHDAFLSSNAQDFIEEYVIGLRPLHTRLFLSSNAQDFIEDIAFACGDAGNQIPEQ